MNGRGADLIRFYSLLDRLEERIGGSFMLAECSGRMPWLARGVYFFRERGEDRTDTGLGQRVVRVGTHALKAGANTRLWSRLVQHKGQQAGNGNHRGSIFRLLVGVALCNRNGWKYPTWGKGRTASGEIRAGERALECDVSIVIGQMPFLWLSLEDEPGPDSLRGFIERNAIALLSNYEKPTLDPPSPGWLGRHSDRERVRSSGLWNSNHVDEGYDPGFLEELDRLISAAGSPS